MAQPPTGPPAGLPDLGQGMEQARHLLQQNKPMEALRVGGRAHRRHGADVEGVSRHRETTLAGAASAATNTADLPPPCRRPSCR